VTATENGTGRRKKSGERWTDWLPPGTPEPPPEELVTRDDILSRLAQSNVPTDEREFRYLQSLGVVPRPTFRRVGGATVGQYPRWVYNAASSALTLRAEGLSWDYIRDRIRGNPTHVHLEGARPPDPPGVVTEAIEQLAAWNKDLTGRTAVRAEVRLFDGRGHYLGGVELAGPETGGKLEISNTITGPKLFTKRRAHPPKNDNPPPS